MYPHLDKQTPTHLYDDINFKYAIIEDVFWKPVQQHGNIAYE